MKLGGKPNIIYSLNTLVRFGKHDGKTIEEIINQDVGWLFWAVDNDVIMLNNAATAVLESCTRPDDEDFEMYYEHMGEW